MLAYQGNRIEGRGSVYWHSIDCLIHTGRTKFREALGLGTMECFFPLIEQFSTQDEPAYCGLASLAMVLNALQIDPVSSWASHHHLQSGMQNPCSTKEGMESCVSQAQHGPLRTDFYNCHVYVRSTTSDCHIDTRQVQAHHCNSLRQR